jgi:methionyl-tRNA synthetase
VEINHLKQKEALGAFNIDLSLFSASALGRAGELHREFTAAFIKRLYDNGHLSKRSTLQFYDEENNTFLNGLDPVSTLSGKRPAMREVTNWYIDLGSFREPLEKWLTDFRSYPSSRPFAVSIINEFLEPPMLYIKAVHMAEVAALGGQIPSFYQIQDADKGGMVLVFDTLEDREKACGILAAKGIQYRTGKTLVPFRLTGNIDWSVPEPVLEGLCGLTVWAWPESLWAPISFTMAYLEKAGKDKDSWKDWWCARDARVYQYIGVDNVYFYGLAEMAMFMGWNSTEPRASGGDGDLQLPELIVNDHLLFLYKKASSSDRAKPPMALELLDHYTAEQLRAHFLSLGLGLRSVSFQPKAFDPAADPAAADPALKEGNLLTNVFNRFARTCFYSAQKYYDSTPTSTGYCISGYNTLL